MNSKALSNCYDVLTPEERVPLILAASGRGDVVERDRLVRSAPKVVYSVSNYFGLAEAFFEVSTIHLLDLLATAAEYLQAFWISDDEDEEFGQKMLDCALFYGYLFKVKLAGWRLFCRAHGFDPELCWKPLPGHETVRRTEKLTEHAAFQPEAVAVYLKRLGHDSLLPPTAEGIAADLSETLKARAEWWG